MVLPKKGKLSAADTAREQGTEFIRLRRRYSAVESAINALEVHGLDRCPNHGINGFKRYAAPVVVARNIQPTPGRGAAATGARARGAKAQAVTKAA